MTVEDIGQHLFLQCRALHTEGHDQFGLCEEKLSPKKKIIHRFITWTHYVCLSQNAAFSSLFFVRVKIESQINTGRGFHEKIIHCFVTFCLSQNTAFFFLSLLQDLAMKLLSVLWFSPTIELQFCGQYHRACGIRVWHTL